MGKGSSALISLDAARLDSISSLEIDPEVSYDKPRILTVLAALLEQIVLRNEDNRDPDATEKLTVFHGLRAPSISVEKYLERVWKYANCSPACFVVAFIYLDRIMNLQEDTTLTSLNIHRLLIASVMAAAKYLDDT